MSRKLTIDRRLALARHRRGLAPVLLLHVGIRCLRSRGVSLVAAFDLQRDLSAFSSSVYSQTRRRARDQPRAARSRPGDRDGAPEARGTGRTPPPKPTTQAGQRGRTSAAPPGAEHRTGGNAQRKGGARAAGGRSGRRGDKAPPRARRERRRERGAARGSPRDGGAGGRRTSDPHRTPCAVAKFSLWYLTEGAQRVYNIKRR